MTIKELKELLEQFDENKRVCIADSSRYGNAYAYNIMGAKEVTLSPYWSDDEELIVRIRMGEQIGTVE